MTSICRLVPLVRWRCWCYIPPMDETIRQFVSTAIGKALFPVLIAVIFALIIWIARNTLSNKWGEYLFGHHWYRREQEALRQKAAERASRWLSDLGYWAGKQASRWIRR